MSSVVMQGGCWCSSNNIVVLIITFRAFSFSPCVVGSFLLLQFPTQSEGMHVRLTNFPKMFVGLSVR